MSRQQVRKRPRSLCGAWIAAMVLATLAASAGGQVPPKIDLSPYADPAQDVRITVEPPTAQGLREIAPDEFERDLPHAAEVAPYILAYDYDEKMLTTNPQHNPWLCLYLLLPEAPASSGKVAVWYEKHILQVSGTAHDGPVNLRVSVTTGSQSVTGSIRLVMHTKDPSGALVAKGSSVTVDVGTAGSSKPQIELTNTSRCNLILGQTARWENFDPAVWKDGAAVAVQKTTLEPGRGPEVPIRLALTPRTASAFWTSIRPFSEGDPHTSFDLLVPYEVEGGYPAELRLPVKVRFRPALPVVLLAAVAGAVMSSLVSLLVTTVRGRGSRVWGNTSTVRQRSWEVTKRVALAASMGFIVFVVYLLADPTVKVSIMDVHVDPTQTLPAFAIGLLVGMAPLAWWKKLVDRGGGGEPQPQPSGPAVGAAGRVAGGTAALAAVALVLGASTTVAGGPVFQPISLGYDPVADRLYAISTSPDQVWTANLAEPEPRLALQMQLEGAGTASDHCLVARDRGLWLASVYWRRSFSERTSQTRSGVPAISVMLTELGSPRHPGRGGTVDRSTRLDCGYLGIGFDADHQRLVITDPVRFGVYGLPLTPGSGPRLGSGEEVIASGRGFRAPSCVVVSHSRIFVGDAERHEIYEVDTKTGTLLILLRDAGDPRGLAVSPNQRLYAVDGNGSRLLEYDLVHGRVGRVSTPKEFREPSAVAVDARGRVWVADVGAHAVFEVSQQGAAVRRLRP